jgi:hypothetical protein
MLRFIAKKTFKVIIAEVGMRNPTWSLKPLTRCFSNIFIAGVIIQMILYIFFVFIKITCLRSVSSLNHVE